MLHLGLPGRHGLGQVFRSSGEKIVVVRKAASVQVHRGRGGAAAITCSHKNAALPCLEAIESTQTLGLAHLAVDGQRVKA